MLLKLSNSLKGVLILAVLLVPLSASAQYKNTNGVAIDKPFSDLLKWQRNQEDPEIISIEISSEWKSFDLSKEDNYSIWIGHSTFLIKKNGLTVLTDPIFSNRASPFKNFGPKRLIPVSYTHLTLPTTPYV